MSKAKTLWKRFAAVLLALIMAIGMIPASLGVSAAWWRYRQSRSF